MLSLRITKKVRADLYAITLFFFAFHAILSALTCGSGQERSPKYPLPSLSLYTLSLLPLLVRPIQTQSTDGHGGGSSWGGAHRDMAALEVSRPQNAHAHHTMAAHFVASYRARHHIRVRRRRTRRHSIGPRRAPWLPLPHKLGRRPRPAALPAQEVRSVYSVCRRHGCSIWKEKKST